MKKALLVTSMVLIASMAQAGDWDNWRGPNGNGVANDGNYPTALDAETTLSWKAELPGRGSSTPIVLGDRIYLTSGIGKGEGGKDGVLAFDWNGKEQWRTELGNQRPGKHKNGSGSNPSLVSDGQRLFAYFKSGTLAALDLNGKVLWQTNLQKAYGEDSLWWDLGTSPVLAGPNVVVAVMHEEDSYLVAFNQETGKEAWKVARNYDVTKETGQSYTTPIVMEQQGKLALIIWGADHLTAHDAADGSIIWECGGFNPENKEYWRVIASPVISDGVAVVPYGRTDYIAGVKIGGKGDVTKTHRLWEKKGIGADVPTPVAANGKVYNLSDKGVLTCLDIKTGNEIWSESMPKARGKFYASPTMAGNTLYTAREDGDIFVVQVVPNFKVLSATKIEDRFAAAPVLINDKVLLRGVSHLYCFGK